MGSGQALRKCCGSESLRHCHFDCFSEESLSLEVDFRYWRCRALVFQLDILKGIGILLENGPQITECVKEGCSNAPWDGTTYCHNNLVTALLVARQTPKSFVERLHGIRDSRKARNMAKFEDPYSQTGFYIEEPADMLDFFMTDELDMIHSSMEAILGLVLDGSDKVRNVDVEFSGPILLQVSIRSGRKLLYKRTVDHEIMVKEVYEIVLARVGPFNFALGPLHKFHGPPSQKLTGESRDTSTLAEISAEIERDGIIKPEHNIVEWSNSRCDYRYIYAAAEKAGFAHLMPPVENSVLCIRPLKKAMPGLFSFSLPILLYMIDQSQALPSMLTIRTRTRSC